MPIALLLAYDGTDFAGYQRQSLHQERQAPTIQGTLEDALARLCGVPVPTIAAGRTDAGVHATGQVVTFRADRPAGFTPADWQRAINALLPASIAVRAAASIPEGIDARRAALSRAYRYRILRDMARNPLRERYAYREARPLNIAAMRAAAAHLVGEHDFAAFGQSPVNQRGQPKRLTVRMVHRADLAERGDEVHFTIAANAFLTGMVRRITGTLLLVGRGQLSPAEFAALLAAASPAHPGPAAPPHGLCLVRVEYPSGTIAWPAGAADTQNTEMREGIDEDL